MNKKGYTVTMYTKQGGAVGFWKESLSDALDEIKNWKGNKHEGIVIVKTSYKGRIARYVIQRPKNLDDSGIFSRKSKEADG